MGERTELKKTEEYKNFRSSFVFLLIVGVSFCLLMLLITRDVIQPNSLYAFVFVPVLIISTFVFMYHKDVYDNLREEQENKEIEDEIRAQFFKDYKEGKYLQLKIEVKGEDVREKT